MFGVHSHRGQRVIQCAVCTVKPHSEKKHNAVYTVKQQKAGSNTVFSVQSTVKPQSARSDTVFTVQRTVKQHLAGSNTVFSVLCEVRERRG